MYENRYFFIMLAVIETISEIWFIKVITVFVSRIDGSFEILRVTLIDKRL